MRRSPRSLIFVLAIAGAFGALLFTGCGKRESAVDRATREGTLLFDNGAEPRDLDPHLVTGMPEHRIIKSILEGLVVEHPTDSNQVVPGVAERWESNATADLWTFHLRADARWSNGDPVVAGDFIYAYQRILNPALAAPYAEMLHLVDGAKAFNEGASTDWSTVGVAALDPHTLQFRLVGPATYFPLLLSHYTYFPLHRPTIEAMDAFARRGSGWTRPGTFVGNGPFVLTEWKPNQRITVRKSPTYWDVEKVGLEAIEYYPFMDRNTSTRNFLAGQLHLTDNIPFNLRDSMRAQKPELVAEDPLFATNYLGLNVRSGPLSDARVRRALHAAIDVQTIIDRVTKNGEPAAGFVPPGIDHYPYRDYVDYDPESARELLAEAGHPGGAGMEPLLFITANSDTSRTFAEIIQSMWKRELGVDVVIENKEWQVLISDMDEGNFDIFSLAWIGDYIDPATFLKIMVSGGGNNRTGFADARYDQLLEDSTREADPTRRFEILAEAEALLMDERPIIPLYWGRNLYLCHPDVKGWSHEKRIMDQPWKFVSLEPSGYTIK